MPDRQLFRTRPKEVTVRTERGTGRGVRRLQQEPGAWRSLRLHGCEPARRRLRLGAGRRFGEAEKPGPANEAMRANSAAARERLQVRIDLALSTPSKGRPGYYVSPGGWHSRLVAVRRGRGLERQVVAFDGGEFQAIARRIARLRLTDILPPGLVFADGSVASGTGVAVLGRGIYKAAESSEARRGHGDALRRGGTGRAAPPESFPAPYAPCVVRGPEPPGLLAIPEPPTTSRGVSVSASPAVAPPPAPAREAFALANPLLPASPPSVPDRSQVLKRPGPATRGPGPPFPERRNGDGGGRRDGDDGARAASATEAAPEAPLHGRGSGAGAAAPPRPGSKEKKPPKAFCVPPRSRRVMETDCLPYLTTLDGRPYHLASDGAVILPLEGGGSHSVSFDPDSFDREIRDLEELGLLDPACPPVLVQSDGSLVYWQPPDDPSGGHDPSKATTVRGGRRGLDPSERGVLVPPTPDRPNLPGTQPDASPSRPNPAPEPDPPAGFSDSSAPSATIPDPADGGDGKDGAGGSTRSEAAAARARPSAEEPAAPPPLEGGEEEEAWIIPTTDIPTPQPSATAPPTLRRPLTVYHLFAGGIGGWTGTAAAGCVVVGGCDGSSRARRRFEGANGRTLTLGTARHVEDVRFRDDTPDILFAAPPSQGLECGSSAGAEIAAVRAVTVAVACIFRSRPKAAVVETSWELTTVKSGAVYKGLGKQAAQEGYEMFFRHVSPHRHGGVEVRPRMFLIFVPAESVEIAGPLPLFGPSRRPSPTVTVRSILDPDQPREEIEARNLRWRRQPRQIGSAILLGHHGRGGRDERDMRDTVWSVDGGLPPVEGEKSALFLWDGAYIRLTAREFARARGIPDSVDIGEGEGPRAARTTVRQSPSAAAVYAVMSVVRDYVRTAAARSVAREGAASSRPPAPPSLPQVATMAPMRTHPDGSPKWCRRQGCPLCRAEEALFRTPRRRLGGGGQAKPVSEAFRLLAGLAFLWVARKEGDSSSPLYKLEPGEEEAHAAVGRDLRANWHGAAHVYCSLSGPPYREVKAIFTRQRTILFWRFPNVGFSAKPRRWARDGAPTFRGHGFQPPTRDRNYDSGDGDVAEAFLHGFVHDGIISRVSRETAEAKLRTREGAVNPLATVPKSTPGKFRLITDARRSGANLQLCQMPSHFPEPLAAIQRVVPKGGYSWSSDQLDCFYGYRLDPTDGWFYMVRIRDDYFKYERLTQGGRNSPHACLALGYCILELYHRGRGYDRAVVQTPGTPDFDPSAPAIQFLNEAGAADEHSLHMDDVIGGGRTEEAAFEGMRNFHHHQAGLGVHPSWGKLVPPGQTGTDYGGYAIDSSGEKLEVRLKERARDQLHAAALGALGQIRSPARSLARLAGLSERAFLLNKAFRVWLNRYYGFAKRVKGAWDQWMKLLVGERGDLRQIVQVAREDGCYTTHAGPTLHVQIGDASGFRAGGAVRYDGGRTTAWTGAFPAEIEQQVGSNIKELRRLQMQMERHLQDDESGRASVRGSTLFDFTDSMYVEEVCERGRADTARGSTILRAIQRACIALQVKLMVFHIAGTRMIENGVDGLSRRNLTADEVNMSSWAEGMAPAAATPPILKAVAEAFGPREVVTVPQRPGELAGKRMVIFPEPWAAASWAELLKRACVIDTETDVVIVIPRRAHSAWRRSFKFMHEVGSTRAGELDMWPASEHEALKFYWLPRHIPPPLHHDRYFLARTSSRMRQTLMRLREADGWSRPECAAAELSRALGQAPPPRRRPAN